MSQQPLPWKREEFVSFMSLGISMHLDDLYFEIWYRTSCFKKFWQWFQKGREGRKYVHRHCLLYRVLQWLSMERCPLLLLRHFGSFSPFDFTKQDVENYGVASEMVVSLFLADTSKQTKLVHTFVLTDFRIFNESNLYNNKLLLP